MVVNRREYEDAIRRELEEWPGATVEFVEGGKHPKAKLGFGGKVRSRPFAGTPSDSAFGVHQMLGDMRRVLKLLGAARAKPEPTQDEDEAPYRKPNDGAARRPSPFVSEPGSVKRGIADGLADAGVVTPECAAAARQPLVAITSSGAYPDISAEAYHRDANLCPGPSISSTGLKTLLNRSPRHYWWDSPLNPERPPEKDKPHYNVGKAAHDLLLLSERWPEAYHVLPANFNARATAAQGELHAERGAARDAGLTILTHVEGETVHAMATALRANPFAAAALSNGEAEVTLAWQDQETGVWLRARPDFLPAKRRIVPDLKTAADGARSAFARAIANYGYHMSAALYIDGIKAVFGAYPEHWLHVVLEKEPPHVVSLYELPGEDVERGRFLNRQAIRAFADCLSADRWPGYADEPAQVGLPAWSRKIIDEDLTPEGVAWSGTADTRSEGENTWLPS